MKYAILFVLSLAWASAFIFTKIADQYVGPLFVVAARGVLGSSFLILLAAFLPNVNIRLNLNKKKHLLLLLSSLLIGYLWFVIAFSEQVLPANLASLMPATTPVFSWLLCLLLRTKQFRWVNFAGILLAAAGVMVALGINHLVYGVFARPEILLLSGFFALALNSVLINRYFSDYDPLVITTYSVSYAALCSLLLLALTNSLNLSSIPVNAWLSLFGAGILSTGLGYAIYFWLVRHAGPVFTSLFGYFVPIIGFILAALLFKDALSWLQVLGVGLVFIGVMFVSAFQDEVSASSK